MVPASVNEKYVIRFCVCAQNATDEDIEYAWKTLSKMATDVIEKVQLLVHIFSAFFAWSSANTFRVTRGQLLKFLTRKTWRKSARTWFNV